MLPPIKWDSFLGKLNAIAYKWFRDEGYTAENCALNGIGISVKDLVQESLLYLIKKLTKYKPKTEDDCFRLVYKIMRHKFLDFLKKKAYQLSEEIKSEDHSTTKLITETKPFTIETLYTLTNGDKNLIDFVDAVSILNVEKPNFKREDIAYFLNCSSEDITKLTNKLRYRASKKYGKLN